MAILFNLYSICSSEKYRKWNYHYKKVVICESLKYSFWNEDK